MSKSRAVRRQAARDGVKLARSRLRLAALEPGGAADRPLEVESASVIELRATGAPCVACGELGLRVEEHAAKGGSLRLVRVACKWCGVAQDRWFRVVPVLPS